MIKVIEKKKNKKKQNPYYLLEFNYMIGDSNGYTEEEITCPIEHAEIIERFVRLINGLEPLKGTWGIVLDSHDFVGFLNEGQLNQEDYDFLKKIMFHSGEEGDDDMRGYFSECIRSEAEYSFLVFESVSLYYYDENGVKFKTEIV